jgi:hypothetical protein
VLLQVRSRGTGQAMGRTSAPGWCHDGGVVDEDSRTQPRPVAALALTFATLVGLLTFGYGFLTAYMLNDQVGPADHVRFLMPVAIGALVATALTAVIVHHDRPWDRAVRASLLWCVVPTAAVAAVIVLIV